MFNGLHGLLKPPAVDAWVVCQLGVEARAKNVVLLHGHNIAIGSTVTADTAQHASRSSWRQPMVVVQNLGDDGGPDEDGGKGVGQERQVHGVLEAVDLATKVVSVDADVQTADELLAALLGGVDLLGQKDESGTGAPGGLLVCS